MEFTHRCKNCGKEFYPELRWHKWCAKYCSYTCWKSSDEYKRTIDFLNETIIKILGPEDRQHFQKMILDKDEIMKDWALDMENKNDRR